MGCGAGCLTAGARSVADLEVKHSRAGDGWGCGDAGDLDVRQVQVGEAWVRSWVVRLVCVVSQTWKWGSHGRVTVGVRRRRG